jgi:hypothetical protein
MSRSLLSRTDSRIATIVGAGVQAHVGPVPQVGSDGEGVGDRRCVDPTEALQLLADDPGLQAALRRRRRLGHVTRTHGLVDAPGPGGVF